MLIKFVKFLICLQRILLIIFNFARRLCNSFNTIGEHIKSKLMIYLYKRVCVIVIGCVYIFCIYLKLQNLMVRFFGCRNLFFNMWNNIILTIMI